MENTYSGIVLDSHEMKIVNMITDKEGNLLPVNAVKDHLIKYQVYIKKPAKCESGSCMKVSVPSSIKTAIKLCLLYPGSPLQYLFYLDRQIMDLWIMSTNKIIL